jgi:Transglycosylase-like domain
VHIRSIPTRALVLVAIGVGLLGLAACEPGDPAAQLFVAKAQIEGNVIASRTAGGPSDAVLARLRNCESGGNYGAVSGSGAYRGAYQFSRQTWNNAARNFLPGYVGVDPAAAPPHIQDAMARVLWQSGGRGQWPLCGPRAG